MINLAKAIEKGLDKHEGEHEWDESRIHISDLAVGLEELSEKKCPLQLWLRYNHYHKKENNAGTKLMFQQGNNLHELVAELLEEGLPGNWEVVGVEKPVKIDFITGRYDFQIKNKDTGKRYIIDFKTVRGNAFGYLHKPKASHTLQVQSYTMAENADGGFVLYIDREGQNFVKQFEVKRNDVKVQKAINKVKEIRDSERPPEVLPPKIKINENKGDDSVVAKLRWQCRYCNYYGETCDGAIPPEYEEDLGKVVGHLNDEGEFTEKIDGIAEYLEGVI